MPWVTHFTPLQSWLDKWRMFKLWTCVSNGAMLRNTIFFSACLQGLTTLLGLGKRKETKFLWSPDFFTWFACKLHTWDYQLFIYFLCGHLNTKNTKYKVCQSQVCYLHNPLPLPLTKANSKCANMAREQNIYCSSQFYMYFISNKQLELSPFHHIQTQI